MMSCMMYPLCSPFVLLVCLLRISTMLPARRLTPGHGTLYIWVSQHSNAVTSLVKIKQQKQQHSTLQQRMINS